MRFRHHLATRLCGYLALLALACVGTRVAQLPFPQENAPVRGHYCRLGQGELDFIRAAPKTFWPDLASEFVTLEAQVAVEIFQLIQAKTG